MTERIAITGMAFHFPGGNTSSHVFWEFVNSARAAVDETPASRFDVDEVFSADPDTLGTTYSRRAGYVENPFLFDAAFFRISEAEALEMDPQQRWLLQLSWAALEHSGIRPSELRGERVGLFLTTGEVDYARRTVCSGDASRITTYAKLGANRGVAAGRVAHFLGVHGPALYIDTACSSSLVAVHLAAQSLRTGDCDIAIAGGVNLILGPEETIGVARLRAMSKSDQCRPFDSKADGYIRGEGGGVVVLKRLDDALERHDRIEAVLAGSAVNNDGASNGLTAPSGAAQEDVITQALSRAGARPEHVVYVEAHGTGTPLGDPIELTALRNVYAKSVERRTPLLVGSIKSQLGHLEVAAGMAGLIKSILILRNRYIPAQVNFDEPNPRFRWEGSNIEVPRTGRKVKEDSFLVGVSGFGIGGTNAHLVVGPPSATERHPQTARQRVLTLSARSAEGQSRLARAYGQFLAGTSVDLRDLCYTASVKRDHWSHRLAIVGGDVAELLAGLDDYESGGESGLWHAGVRSAQRRRLAFLFPGQGAWRPGVGGQLFDDNPIFQRFVKHCLRLLATEVSHEVMDAIAGRNAAAVRHHPGQLAHFIVLYSLARTWMELGLLPDVVLGHSLGEHVAAVIAGVMSLEDGLLAVEARGRLFDHATPRGAMLAVAVSADDVGRILQVGEDLFVAGINGPEQTVLSGTADAIAIAAASVTALGKRASYLKTYDTPGHSPLLAPMRASFREALSSISFRTPTIPLVSTLTGHLASSEIAGIEHWLDLVEKPVLFSAALEAISGDDVTFLEVGPGGALSNLACAATQNWQQGISSLADGPDGDETPEPTGFAHACARLYSAGHDVNWSRLYGAPSRPVEAPTYPFEEIHLELPVPATGAAGVRSFAAHDAARTADDHGEISAAVPGVATPPNVTTDPDGARDSILNVIRRLVRTVTVGISSLDENLPLTQAGFDSLAITELRVRLKQEFGLMPPVSLFAKGISLSGLGGFYAGRRATAPASARMAASDASTAKVTEPKDRQEMVVDCGWQDDDEEERSIVIQLKAGTGPVVAMVHPIGGDVLCYADMVTAWPGDPCVYGIRHPEADRNGSTVYRSLSQLAFCYRKELLKTIGRVPDIVGGWSFGGVIAQEMVAQWEDSEVAVPRLFLVDTPVHRGHFVTRLLAIVRDLGWPRGPHLVDALEKDSRFQNMLNVDFGLGEIRGRVSVSVFERLSRVHASNAAAMAWHRPKSVDTALAYALALEGGNGSSCHDMLPHLRLLTKGRVRISEFNEDHFSIVRGDAASKVAEFIARDEGAVINHRNASFKEDVLS